jgi:hypothetical protein
LAPGLASLWLISFLSATPAHAQLAITEVMSHGSDYLGSNFVSAKSDFWELTNFGTNTISLDGYKFNDAGSTVESRTGEPFVNCFIAPGESIIFFRRKEITTVQQFLDWWGPNNLRSNLQVRSYVQSIGFDQVVDAVQLFDPDGNLVDRVDFGRAFQGHTFGYDPETGEFGSFSALGINGAFKAMQTDDVGSPGTTTGPIPLAILQDPESITQDAGMDVEFFVRAAGMPRPSFQWFFNGDPIPNERRSTLTLSNVQVNAAGTYTVSISNYLGTMTSAPAELTVNASPLPAMIIVPPVDMVAFDGQTALFTVRVRGFPNPTIQWQRNGVNIPGATSTTLSVPNVTLDMDGSIFTVQVQNSYGSANASAGLRVTTTPRLVITEIMPSAIDGNDWFELTNLETNAVDLTGYRFSDTTALSSAYRITNSLVIEPGESVIFVERFTPEQFGDWWGRDRLPPGLKIVTYYGLGFSREGDILLMWNAAATVNDDWRFYALYGTSEPGISVRYDAPDYYLETNSFLGANGTFRAARGNDIGSPGYTTNPPPRFTAVIPGESGPSARCRVTEGKTYDLQFKTYFTDSDWVTLESYFAQDFIITIPLQFDSEVGERFFQLREAP